MRWVIAFFLALLSIPVAQVAADAWTGRPGPELPVVAPYTGVKSEAVRHVGGNPSLAASRRRHYRFYDPLAPWFPGSEKAG